MEQRIEPKDEARILRFAELDAQIIQAETERRQVWKRDPLALAQTKGTSEVHRISEAVN
jgi:hypothetical protein